MECVQTKVKITEAFQEIESFNYTKKRKEEITNRFLDRILDLQSEINEDSSFLENLCITFEELTWSDSSSIDNETYDMLKEVMETSKAIHRLMLIRFVFLNKNARQYASKELKRFKLALDDIKECILDIESVFFVLPHNEDFQEANKKIQSL